MIMKRSLTLQQQAFVNNYIRNGFNAFQAAINAGYSDNYARVKSSKLIGHPTIKEQIKQACITAEERSTVSWEWRMNKLKSIVEAFVPEDKSTMRPANARAAVAAIAEINKMTGDYAPDKKLSLTVDLTKKRLEEARKVYEEF